MPSNALKVGRYALGERIAAGGMATVHLGRLDGSAGFSRTVAIKRLHPHLCEDPSFTGAFADEARLAARIRHPNVVPTLDVVSTEGELLIVMEYVDGDSLSSLMRKLSEKEPTERIPLPIVVAIVSEMLHGLHSAHEAKSETGKPLHIVHRDVSPQNVLVGADGVARLVDFGIARANAKNRQATTGENDLKGKLAYMAPEQIRREKVDRRTDLYAAGIVLWELLTGERLFASDNEAATMEKILVGWVQPPRTVVLDLPEALNDITLRALDPDPNNRFDTARDMAMALEDALGRALGREVGAWVERIAVETLSTRRAMIAQSEKESSPLSTHTDLSSLTPAKAPDRDALTTLASVEPPTTPRREPFARPAPSPEIEPTTGPGLPLAHLVDPDEAVRQVSAPPVPLGMEYERTVTSFGEELSYQPPAKRRSQTDRIAYTVFALALLLTVVVAVLWSRISPSPAPAFSPLPPPPAQAREEPAFTAEPIQTSTPPPPPVDPVVERIPDKRDRPDDKPVGTPSQHPIVRPTIHAKPRPPAKQPCTSKLDPATGKTVYQGDCN